MGCGCNKKEDVKVEKLVKNSKLESFAKHCYNNKWIFGIFILIIIIIILYIITNNEPKNEFIVLPPGSIRPNVDGYNVDLPNLKP